jgi:hypothetical protein
MPGCFSVMLGFFLGLFVIFLLLVTFVNYFFIVQGGQGELF